MCFITLYIKFNFLFSLTFYRVATVRENVREIGNVREKKLNVRENFGKVESQGIFVKCQGNLWIYM